eukprot:1167299-Karenia_brevis.AAC.1
MQPATWADWQQNEASWGDFYLTDGEPQELCRDVMATHTAAWPAARKASQSSSSSGPWQRSG